VSKTGIVESVLPLTEERLRLTCSEPPYSGKLVCKSLKSDSDAFHESKVVTHLKCNKLEGISLSFGSYCALWDSLL
jgi:hypothetical protein